MSAFPRVAVFDAGLPPAIAFVRSLGRAGVPVTVYSPSGTPAARLSRYAGASGRCPSLENVDGFLPWLADELRSGRIDLVAPTSDGIAFAIAELRDEFAPQYRSRLAAPDAVLDCLFKDRFAHAMACAGFPTPRTTAAADAEEAAAAAEAIGYPVLVKPRSHVGIGIDRGGLVRSVEEMPHAFHRYEIPSYRRYVAERYPELALPLVQEYLAPERYDVVSVSGHLDVRGRAEAVNYARKRAFWPTRTGIGTLFERIPEPPFGEHAVEAASRVLGSGIFELEVLVDRASGDYAAIDLNPRAFGQMALDIASGNDLPALWYQSVTGTRLRVSRRRRSPRYWTQAVPYLAGSTIGLRRGRGRPARIMRFARSVLFERHVHAVHQWTDPLPSVAWTWRAIRHPGGIVRPFLRESEAIDGNE